MSQTDSAPLRTNPHEFGDSLKTLLISARRGTVTFDRAWTFRREDDHPDLMVEVTRLTNNRNITQTCGDPASTMDETEFEAELSSLLRDAQLSRIGFDRAWTFRCADGPDLMVEITRLAKR